MHSEDYLQLLIMLFTGRYFRPEDLRQRLAGAERWGTILRRAGVAPELAYGMPGALSLIQPASIIAQRTEAGRFIVSPGAMFAAGANRQLGELILGTQQRRGSVAAGYVTDIVREQLQQAQISGTRPGTPILAARLTEEARKRYGVPEEMSNIAGLVTYRRGQRGLTPEIHIPTRQGVLPFPFRPEDIQGLNLLRATPEFDFGTIWERFQQRIGGFGAGSMLSAYEGQKKLRLGIDFEWNIDPYIKASDALFSLSKALYDIQKSIQEIFYY